MTGLRLDEVRLVPPDAGWGLLFAREAVRLRSVPYAMGVEHIGSTAIPGIKAKPVVDVALAMAVAADDVEVRQALVGLGYAAHGDYGLPGREFFTLGDPPVLHLHVVRHDSPHWRDWLDFRDYLRGHPEDAATYEREKERLMAEVRGDRAAYTRGKGTIVAHILGLARSQGCDTTFNP